MDAASIAAVLHDFGPIVAVTALLAGLVQQLVKYILQETVSKEIYEKSCEVHSKVETAVDNLTESISEVTHGQTTTNRLLEILLKEDVRRRGQ